MSLNLEQITGPVSEDNPSGEFLEYDPLYMKLEEYALGVPAKQMGDSIVEGHEPDWNELRKSCLALFEKTRDLRIATYLTLAELCLHGYPGFRDGMKLISVLLKDYWDTVWPQLDPDDDNDPLERMNVLSSLSPIPGAYQDPMMFIQHLRNAPLTFSKQMGKFSLRDVMVSNGEIDAGESTPPEMSLINAALMDTPFEKLEENANAITECIVLINDISAYLNEKVGENNTLSFESLLSELNKIDKLYSPHLGSSADSAADESDKAPAEAAADSATNGAALGQAAVPQTAPKQTLSISTLEITSRADAIKVLEKICAYFEKAEPNSPIPFLLRRATRIANMSYVDLIQEMTPDALDQVKTILGLKESDQDESSSESDES